MSATYNNCDRRLGNGYCNLSKGHSGTCNIVPRTRPKAQQASEGARQIADKLASAGYYATDFWTEQQSINMAALIDAELRELLTFIEAYASHAASCAIWPSGMKKRGECTCGLAALLSKWKTEAPHGKPE